MAAAHGRGLHLPPPGLVGGGHIHQHKETVMNPIGALGGLARILAALAAAALAFAAAVPAALAAPRPQPHGPSHTAGTSTRRCRPARSPRSGSPPG